MCLPWKASRELQALVFKILAIARCVGSVYVMIKLCWSMRGFLPVPSRFTPRFYSTVSKFPLARGLAEAVVHLEYQPENHACIFSQCIQSRKAIFGKFC